MTHQKRYEVWLPVACAVLLFVVLFKAVQQDEFGFPTGGLANALRALILIALSTGTWNDLITRTFWANRRGIAIPIAAVAAIVSQFFVEGIIWALRLALVSVSGA